jgi:poly(3-hydroxybutyrate) depolymerase
MRSLLITFAVLVASSVVASPTLSLNIDPDQVTVSGISAGGQMAHQLHIAYPDVFSGVGIIAGGPFGCAEGSLATAMTRCMGNVDGELPLAQFAEEIRSAAKDGTLGDTAMLADDPVWVFHGALDKTVDAKLSDATVKLYDVFMPSENIRYVNDVEVAHTFPTRDHGNECTSTASPFIGDCDYDAAGELLQHLYGKLKKPAENLIFKLTETTLPGALAAGLLETAYLYVPPACTNTDQSCKAQLVLHGCAQSTAQIGTVFIEQSGYLPWAEANNIVLAFPQVAPAAANPIACWDWWGYTGASYRWRDGAQMKVLADWMQELSVP